jgi:hypothetical protein
MQALTWRSVNTARRCGPTHTDGSRRRLASSALAGDLIFLTNSALFMLCVPDEEDVPPDDRLLREYFGMHRFEWPDDPAVEFHLNHGDCLRLLRGSGFEVTDLIELRPPEQASTRYRFITLDWARRWPAEEVWKARKRG